MSGFLSYFFRLEIGTLFFKVFFCHESGDPDDDFTYFLGVIDWIPRIQTGLSEMICNSLACLRKICNMINV